MKGRERDSILKSVNKFLWIKRMNKCKNSYI